MKRALNSFFVNFPSDGQLPSNLIFFFKSIQQNHPAERKWVEFNARVNYPIKKVLNAMVNDDQLNMEDDIVKFSVSYFTTKVAAVGIKQVFDSWNKHTIPGEH